MNDFLNTLIQFNYLCYNLIAFTYMNNKNTNNQNNFFLYALFYSIFSMKLLIED